MTIDISNNAARVNYTVASGVTQTSFSVPFEFFNDGDLSVYVDDVLKTITTHYTVSGGDGSTGTITMSVTGAAGGSTVVISRSIAIERTSDFQTGVDINRAALNTQLDTLTAIAADNQDKASRSISAPNSEVNPVLELPDADTRKGKLIGFNETTGNIELSATLADGNTLASISGDIATLADIEDGTDATDAIQTVAGISSNVTTVAGVSANVTTVAGNTTNINTVAGSDANITTLADNVSAISIVSDDIGNVIAVAINAANINTVAADGADIGTVAGDISNVNTVATNVASVNTNATNITDIQNASANAATATTQAGIATTQAGIATTKASEAATSETNAATSETNAATSETNASTSETNAATSATDAASSATNASGSASAALNFQTQAGIYSSNAASSASSALSSKNSASSFATNSANSATNASNSASTATTKASEAAASASAASTSEANADTSEANALTYSSNAATSAAAAASSAAGIAGYNLDVIAETIADTAVDVFVYDTSKDSDGGAWRKRTQATSWYNETLNTSTRGSRKEFPAVAVIVAEANTVTIYDGDDPDLPMWMVFNSGSTGSPLTYRFILTGGVTGATASNGQIGVCRATLTVVDFVGDRASYNSVSLTGGFSGANVSQRNDFHDQDGGTNYLTSNLLVSNTVNDVAMTVLPNAPVDAATGLPVLTIAVATEGGLSVITDSGAVYDSESTTVIADVAFDDDNTVYYMRGLSSYALFMAETSDYTSGDGFGTTIASTGLATQAFNLISNRSQTTTAFGKSFVASGGVSSTALPRLLGLYAVDKTNLANTMTAGIHYEYNTGWMNGAIKLATLSDTDDTDVTGSELVPNYDFSTTENWTLETGWAITGGELVDSSTTSENANSDQFSMVGGKKYVLSFQVTGSGGTPTVFIRKNGVDTDQFQVPDDPSDGVYSYTFTPDTTGSDYNLEVSSGNFLGSFDFISVRLAEEDRSVNGNGLQVFGTVTKNPVATGADLVGYSGFTSSNYLQQPYNADLEVGTGDIVFMGWVKKGTNDSQQTILQRDKKGENVGAGSFEINILPTSGYVSCQTYDGTVQAVTSTIAVPETSWSYVVAGIQNGLITLYVNGVLQGTTAATTLSTDQEDVVIFGVRSNLTSAPADTASFALWRISTTFPSPEQIAKIYEDEKVLFQENSQATLYGSSDAVTALAYDDTTELLHVGTSAGRSVFQGLRRVDNTTDAVGAAISASNGLVAED